MKEVYVMKIKKNERYRAYKFRIYPNANQQELMNKTFGCVRYVYNYMLWLKRTKYKNDGVNLSATTLKNLLPSMKDDVDTAWLSDVDSIALQSSIEDLDDAFQRFFKGQNRYPRFKKKSFQIDSYRTKPVNGNIRLDDNKIKFPRLGWVKYAKSREVYGKIINVTVRRSSSGKYFVSVLVKQDVYELPKTGKLLGIDWGLHDFIATSDGEVKKAHKVLHKYEDKLAKEQRILARRKRSAEERGMKLSDAMNYQKQRVKVARIHEKIKHSRNDFLHKLSTNLVKNHDEIFIEDIHLKGLLKNNKLSKSVSDSSWHAFVSMLEYKAEWYGRTVMKINRYFPSSQVCSSCGRCDGKKPLHIRQWTCSNCNTSHHRDVNAAKNILQEGLSLSKSA